MPDINLLKDTERLEQSGQKPPPPPQFEMSSPSPAERKGLGGVFRSLFSRLKPPPVLPPKSDTGTMSLGKNKTSERILSEKRKAGSAVIPLPDDESFNVNLLTEDLTGGITTRQKLIQLGLVGVGAVVVVGLIYFGLTLYERNVTRQVAETKRELDRVNQEIQSLQDEQDTIVATSKKMAAIQSLIDQHVRWTKFFERLEHYLLPSVTLGTTFTGDVQGSMNFSATTDSYENVAAQYLLLEQAVANRDFIQSFKITGASRSVNQNIETVTFTIGIVLEPSLLENAATPLAATDNQTAAPPL